VHSILALSASHLFAGSESSVAEQAIKHRTLAVQSLNEALATPPKTQCERDARMAAALALSFQASHLRDGLAEFLTMVRGSNLMAGDEIYMKEEDPVFQVSHRPSKAISNKAY
jgi:hypothetical protein